MLEQQPDEVVAAALWELESSVSRALPRGALVNSARAHCGGYDVAAKWAMSTVRGNRQECTVAVHFSLDEAKAYCRLNHPRREEICRRVSEWLSVQLEFQGGEQCADTGYDLVLTAPNAFFLDERDAIRVGREDREHDFSLYRGASVPPLT
ncbi:MULTISPECIES: hypothetical protein [Ralstonia]|uniref:Uncharacterized protein n=1 Tax=Ralstonia holmesii TaxID=3058602 RepID=A0ABC8QKV9_9RALS|nr:MULTISPECIES: hypothetical protein [unclassified Ralstonia]CAJ0801379.1 hypothetical protein LMG18096_03974 [Ralstonia sp. LMG 32967]CAJ0811825.1 hypothetical protein LMG18093_01483 [Ralstonia sp. LMG 32967]